MVDVVCVFMFDGTRLVHLLNVVHRNASIVYAASGQVKSLVRICIKREQFLI